MSATANPDADKLVRVHQKISAALKKLKTDYEAAAAVLKGQQDTVESAMLQFLNDTKQKTAKTENGLFYWQVKLTPSGADWGALYAWVREENAFEVFHKRISSTFIKTYMEENENALPPGVNVKREREICVRKSAT